MIVSNIIIAVLLSIFADLYKNKYFSSKFNIWFRTPYLLIAENREPTPNQKETERILLAQKTVLKIVGSVN